MAGARLGLETFDCAIERTLQDQAHDDHHGKDHDGNPRQRPGNDKEDSNEEQGEQEIRCRHDGAGREEFADRLEIPHLVGQDPDRTRPLCHLDGEHMLENIARENDVELLARYVDAGPDRAQEKIERNRYSEPDAERDERGERPVRHHAVIDVHYEEGRGERQHIDDEGRDGDMAVIRPEPANHAPEPVRPKRLRGSKCSFARGSRPDEKGLAQII
jgi:hypothetical protein